MGQASVISPSALIRYCLENRERIQGTSISFNEPTLSLEYALDLFKLAKQNNLYNTFVSNGYMTRASLKLLIEAGLDALKIDIKGGPKIYEKIMPNANWRVPWKNASFAIKNGVHVEIVCLLITDINDDEESIEFIIRNHLKYLGSQVPLHFTRYFPAYKYNKEPTNISKLKKARNLAMKEGIQFVYTGNLYNDEGTNTYCPNCKATLIERRGYTIQIKHLKKLGKKTLCSKCSWRIPIILP
ncbi:MAG: radical SAM protein [Promethearchaeota archaeon]